MFKHCFYYWLLLILNFCVCVCAQLCPALCNAMDYSLPVSSVYGIFQARILQWVVISFLGALPNPGIEPASPALTGGFFITEPTGKPILSL